MSAAVGRPAAGRSAATPVADRDALEALIESGGDRLRERMAHIELYLERVTASAGAPLAAYANATIMAGGKRLRPLLVVLAAESGGLGSVASAPGNTAASEECLIRAAAAVELVHSATLVHDDVIDRAPLRRGTPTVAATAGRHAAIATGDLLFSRAFAELARNDDLAQLCALSDASSALAAGELLQREDAYASHVAIERYLRRCELKTAALFEAACRLGALVAGGAGVGATDLADALGAFARRIGLAFQILDDVLDVSGPVEHTGKSRGTDLLDGTVTLPLILARERDRELAEVDLAALDGARQAEELCERIAATGALEQARERAFALVAEAKAMLPATVAAAGEAAAPVAGEAGSRGRLEQVADAVVERYR